MKSPQENSSVLFLFLLFYLYRYTNTVLIVPFCSQEHKVITYVFHDTERHTCWARRLRVQVARLRAPAVSVVTRKLSWGRPESLRRSVHLSSSPITQNRLARADFVVGAVGPLNGLEHQPSAQSREGKDLTAAKLMLPLVAPLITTSRLGAVHVFTYRTNDYNGLHGPTSSVDKYNTHPSAWAHWQDVISAPISWTFNYMRYIEI